VTSPEYLRTFRGKYLSPFQALGTLALAGDELLFRATGWALDLPLWRIASIGLRRFPWRVQPFGLRYIEMDYTTGEGEQTLWLTRTYFRTLPAWHTNRVVAAGTGGSWTRCGSSGHAPSHAAAPDRGGK
jgi:hypothetical protein